MNTDHIWIIRLLLFQLLIITTISCNLKPDSKTIQAVKVQSELKAIDKPSIIFQTRDHRFLATLRSAGIFDACKEMGIDFAVVFAPLTATVNHPYRQYSWSVSRDQNGNPVIHALPPKEEMGWTPWERWSMKDKKPVRTSWILYPVIEPIERGIIRWYELEESENLVPRFLHETANLEAKLRLARIDVAAEWLGIDFHEVLIDPLQPGVQQIYTQYRWVVIPHVLADDGPVIYALPPMDKSDDWPWESWYADGRIPKIHHVHYTQEKARTSGSWTEGPGAPQRPPEIYVHTWYWYDDPEMIPAMSKCE